MKKVEAEMQAEYKCSDFSKLERGKFFKAATKGTSVALIEPKLAKAFPTSEAVNEALRGLLVRQMRSQPRLGYRFPMRCPCSFYTKLCTPSILGWQLGHRLGQHLHIHALVLERKQHMVQQRLGFVGNLSGHQQAIRHLGDPSDRPKPCMLGWLMSSIPFAYGVGCSPESSYFLSEDKIFFKKPLSTDFSWGGGGPLVPTPGATAA